ncbi:hypothetical protein AMTRI_Chr06g192860 [Amborella trichopoda]
MRRYIDGFCGGVLPVSKGKSVALVVVDRLSKYAHFIPLSHPYTATVVAQIFFDQVFKLHGMPRTIYCYNTNWHSSIKITLFEVVYGRPPPSLLTYDQNIKELRATLKEAHNCMKKVYDSTLSLRKNLKLSPRYYGPYQIVKMIGVVAYKLNLPEESHIYRCSITLVQTELPPVREDDGTLHPKPQTVLNQRIHKRKKQIIIHWQGMSPAEATGEDLKAMTKQFSEYGLEDKTES